MLEKTYNRRLMGLTAVGAAVGGVALLLPDSPAFGDVAAGPAAQVTAVSPQSPQPTPTSPQGPPPPRPPRFHPVDRLFEAYYLRVDGPRTMGSAISRLTTTVDGRPAQYFEKARLEDRTGES